MNSKLAAVCGGDGRLIIMCLSEGNISDHVGAKLIYLALLEDASYLLGDKGYDSDDFRAALKAKGITPCIPPRKGRNFTAGYSKTLYKQRHKVENMFGRLKDWRCVTTDMTAVTTPSSLQFASQLSSYGGLNES